MTNVYKVFYKYSAHIRTNSRNYFVCPVHLTRDVYLQLICQYDSDGKRVYYIFRQSAMGTTVKFLTSNGNSGANFDPLLVVPF